MPSSTLAQQLLERPDAMLQLQSMQHQLAEEQKRRQNFYEWVTEHQKAEFINGEIIVHSPVKRQHWKITDLLSSLLSVYVRSKKIGVVGTEKVMISLSRNDYEPNLVFFSTEKADLFEADQVLFPAPDFVVEILSKRAAKLDRTIKKSDYAAHGIREYWIIDPTKQHIEQYIRSQDDTVYFPAKIFRTHDTIQSIAVQGFEIPVQAIFDEETNLDALKQILKNGE